MEDWISLIIEQLRQLSPFWVYVVLFIAAYVENIAPPVPGDTVTVFGAYLAGIGVINFWEGWILTNLGSIAGFYTMFRIGKWLGNKFLKRKNWWFFKIEHYEKVSHWFQKYGYGVIAANRFLSGARSIIALSAGISEMKDIPVLAFSAISAIVWNGAIMYAGMQLGTNWNSILQSISRYNKIIFSTVILMIIVWALYQYLKRKVTAK